MSELDDVCSFCDGEGIVFAVMGSTKKPWTTINLFGGERRPTNTVSCPYCLERWVAELERKIVALERRLPSGVMR